MLLCLQINDVHNSHPFVTSHVLLSPSEYKRTDATEDKQRKDYIVNGVVGGEGGRP